MSNPYANHYKNAKESDAARKLFIAKLLIIGFDSKDQRWFTHKNCMLDVYVPYHETYDCRLSTRENTPEIGNSITVSFEEALKKINLFMYNP